LQALLFLAYQTKSLCEEDKPMADIPAFLATMFTDPRWRRIARYIYFAEIGENIAVAAATMSPNRDSFALNRGEFERVLNGLNAGKADQAFVVAAKLNGGRPPEYQGAVDAEMLAARSASRPTIDGIYGEFWSLQLYEIDTNAPL
jgi:hypothetical protein